MKRMSKLFLCLLMITVGFSTLGRETRIVAKSEVVASLADEKFVYISDLNWVSATTGWSTAQKDQGLENLPLRLRSGSVDNIKTYSKGITAHANSEITYNIENKGYERFRSDIGVNYTQTQGTVGFIVKADDVIVYEVAKIGEGEVAKVVDVEIPKGTKQVKLITTDGGDGIAYDHSVWCDARFVYSEEQLLKVDKLQVSAPTNEIVIDETLLLATKALNVVGEEILNQGSYLSYKSENEDIATVSDDGVVSGKADGVTNIIVTYQKDKNIFSRMFTIVVGNGVNPEVPEAPRATPIMGWASWNNYRVNINEELLKEQMDALVNTGLADVGYTYFNMDDGWFGGRGVDGVVKTHPIRFPNGVKVIADYAHSRGLKAGIYTDAGVQTCGYEWDGEGQNGVNVGLYGHDEQDLNMYLNDWGFDFIKVDWCGGKTLGLNQKERYTEIGEVINDIRKDTNRYIIYNVCSWAFPGEWVVDIADSWRTGGDINANFSSILYQVDQIKGLSNYSGPGHVNDLDMLQVGRGMTYEEDKTHFSMWSIMSTPLMLGNDLTTMNSETLEIVKNEEIIALNQDALGNQARVAKTVNNGSGEVYVKELQSPMDVPSKAVVFLNRSTSPLEMSLSWDEIDMNYEVEARDLWAHKDIQVGDKYTVSVPAHGVVVLKVTKKAEIIAVDKSALQALVDSTSTFDETVYTPNSYEALQTALDDAQAVLDNADATQAEVDAAVTELQTAIDALVMRADKSVLDTLIADADTKVKEAYTPESWAAFESVLADAQTMSSDANATQEQVNSAAEALSDAMNALEAVQEESVNTDALQQLISESEALIEEAYTPESWTVLAGALASAKEVLANPETTQADVDAATAQLQAAKDALVAVQGETVNTEALQQLISEIEALDANDYTTASWKQLQAVLADAKATLANPEASQADIDAQVKALQDVKDKLVKKVTVIEKPSTAPTVPAVSGNGGSTNTGDTTNVNFLYAMLLLSGVVVVRRYWKKKMQR